jgi:predicted PurR-regulated permease PerM
MEKQYGSKLFLVIFFCSLVLLLAIFWTYVSSIVLALLITSVFFPMYLWVKRYFKGRENSASLVMSLVALLILVIPVGWFVGTLSNEAFDFYNRTESAVSLKQLQQTLDSDSIWVQRAKKIGKMAGIELTPDTIEELSGSVGKTVGLFLYKQISSVASNLFSLLVHFFLMMMVIFYLFRDGMRLKDYLTELIPVPEMQLEKLSRVFLEVLVSSYLACTHLSFGGR